MTATVEGLSEALRTRHARALYHCSGCDYCVRGVWPERGVTEVCATMSAVTSAPGYSARGYLEAARALADGHALAATGLAERIFTCTTCGNCDSICPLGLAPSALVRDLRGDLIERGLQPARIDEIRATLLRDGNLHGRSRGERDTWMAGLVESVPATVVLQVGCDAAAGCPDEARAAFALLCEAGERPRLAPATPVCCGAPLAELGFESEAGALAAGVAQAMDPQAGEMVTLAPHCARQIRAAGLTRVSGLVTWLWQRVQREELALTLAPDATPPPAVVLLESCQARQASGGDEAHFGAMLGTLGVEVLTPGYPAPHVLCCGAAGGMREAAPGAAERMAANRLAGIPADAVVLTVDPRCAAHLRASAGASSVSGPAAFFQRYCRIARPG